MKILKKRVFWENEFFFRRTKTLLFKLLGQKHFWRNHFTESCFWKPLFEKVFFKKKQHTLKTLVVFCFFFENKGRWKKNFLLLLKQQGKRKKLKGVKEEDGIEN